MPPDFQGICLHQTLQGVAGSPLHCSLALDYAHIIPEINDICSKDGYYWFADKLLRHGHGCWHLL